MQQKMSKNLYSKRIKKLLTSLQERSIILILGGKRRLANMIGKMRMGIYFHSTFTAQPECVEELERTMRINDKVLRFLHYRLDSRQSISQHLEVYREVIAGSKTREQERDAKTQARKAQFKGRGAKPFRRDT